METYGGVSSRMIIFILVGFLMLISVLDCKTKEITDGLSLLGIILALNFQLSNGDIKLAIVGINAGILIVWLMNCLRFTRLGGGDAKLMAFIGACLGWKVVLLTALLAFVIFGLSKNRLRNKGISQVAYSPFISGGLIIVWIGNLFFKI